MSTARSGVYCCCVDDRGGKLDFGFDVVLAFGSSSTPAPLEPSADVTGHAETVSSGDATAMAVDIRWAMTHPTIFSLYVFDCEGTRKR